MSKNIFSLSNCSDGGAYLRILQTLVDRPGQLQRPGLRIAVAILPAAGPLQAQPPVLTLLSSMTKTQRGVQVGKQRCGPNWSNTGQLAPVADDLVATPQTRYLSTRLDNLIQHRVQTNPQQRQLLYQRPVFQTLQPPEPNRRITKRPPMWTNTIHATTPTQLIVLENCLPNAIVIQTNPLLQQHVPVIVAAIDLTEIYASQQHRRLPGINGTVHVPILGNAGITTQITDNDTVHHRLQVAIQPVSHRTFLNRQILQAANLSEHLPETGDAGCNTIAMDHLPVSLHSQICHFAVHVCYDIMCYQKRVPFLLVKLSYTYQLIKHCKGCLIFTSSGNNPSR